MAEATNGLLCKQDCEGIRNSRNDPLRMSHLAFKIEGTSALQNQSARKLLLRAKRVFLQPELGALRILLEGFCGSWSGCHHEN
jgi:hypothetical protein